jgi:hypothetical protein
MISNSAGFVQPIILAGSAMAQIFQPALTVTDTLKRKAAMTLNWQFYKGDPSGAPSAAGYNDSGSGWSTIAVPHSCSYDAPPVVVTGAADWASEWNYYKGNCWYRKTFGVPAATKKLFVEFEGAMQVATVYVNGNQVGVHSASGYTPFYFDITGYITRGADNVIAVKLNNAVNNDIPPGTTYTSQTSGRPDYLLYSGLYRPVWLVSKDSVYIPIYSQHIQTINVSAASAQVRALTPVKNDRPSPQTAEVTVTLLDAAKTSVATLASSLSIPANTQDTSDITLAAVGNPHLWSPSSPYMYSVQTIVRVGGVAVDSVVEPCGFRWITWAAGSSGSFNLNGSRLQIRGMCVHQTLGWIGNAVPDTRIWQEIKMLKDLGCNSVRSAHYPRSQAFLDACDKLGMLVYVEQPSWGWGYTPSALCWARMDTCVKEMIVAARNHPCIYLWGLYNEPIVKGNFTSQITVLNNTAHRLDSTRFTAMSNIKDFNGAATVPDVQGLNYTNAGTAGAYRWINTESRNGFYHLSYRGSTIDLDTTNGTLAGSAYFEWSQTEMPYTLNTSGQLSGCHFWCFRDYNTPCNTNGSEGVVDRLCVPKTIYYMFRKYWTGKDPDYPRPGTATTVQLLCDTNSLRANGADVFLLTATMRDANGRQISTATGKVTFTVSPAGCAEIFGGNSQSAYAGRAGALLRTTTTPGTITVTAAYPGCAGASVSLTTLRDTNLVPPLSSPVSIRSRSGPSLPPDAFRLKITRFSGGYVFHCPPASTGRLSVIDCQGKTVFSNTVGQGSTRIIRRQMPKAGVYYGVWENGALRAVSRFNAGYRHE